MMISWCKPFLFKSLGTWLLLNYLVAEVCGKITEESIRSLTEVTRECRGRVAGEGVVDRVWDEGGGIDGEKGQIILGGGHEDGDEIEDTITAALHILCSDLLVELEKPFSPESDENTLGQPNCTRIKKDFDDFLKETTWFLYEIQERQMRWRWRSGSAIKEGLKWLHGLWASRKRNSQYRSFIEQQLVLYKRTKCFEKLTREVLRKDIEVVEYLNDLIDMFRWD